MEALRVVVGVEPNVAADTLLDGSASGATVRPGFGAELLAELQDGGFEALHVRPFLHVGHGDPRVVVGEAGHRATAPKCWRIASAASHSTLRSGRPIRAPGISSSRSTCWSHAAISSTAPGGLAARRTFSAATFQSNTPAFGCPAIHAENSSRSAAATRSRSIRLIVLL